MTFSQGNNYMSMALAAGILVATILFLVGLSLDILRRFSRQNDPSELLEERNAR